MVGLTTLLYILPLTFADNFLSHRTPDTFLQLIHPAWILLLTFSSHLQSLLTVDPRYLKFLAFFTFSPFNFNSSPSSTPPTLKYSVLLRITFRPLHSSVFLQISRSSSSSLSFCLHRTMSSANSISHGASFLMSSVSLSIMMEKRNRLSAEPWWSPTPTLNYSVNPAALLTVVLAPSYISLIILM